MIQWIEEVDGKACWFQQFTQDEVTLMAKYHNTFERLTKMNCNILLKGVKSEQEV